MMTSKSAGPGEEGRSCATIVDTTVTSTPRLTEIGLIISLEGIERRCKRKTQTKGSSLLSFQAKTRGRSTRVMRIVHKDLLQVPRTSGAGVSQMEPKRIHNVEVPEMEVIRLMGNASTSSRHLSKKLPRAKQKCGSWKRGKIGTQTKGKQLMKTITESKSMRRSRTFLLALCAGVVATFMIGCAEGPYVTAYDGGYYYPTAY